MAFAFGSNLFDAGVEFLLHVRVETIADHTSMNAPIFASRAPAVAVRGMMVSAIASSIARRMSQQLWYLDRTSSSPTIPLGLRYLRWPWPCVVPFVYGQFLFHCCRLKVTFFQFLHGMVGCTSSHRHIGGEGFTQAEAIAAPSVTKTFGASQTWFHLFKTEFEASVPMRAVPISWIPIPRRSRFRSRRHL